MRRMAWILGALLGGCGGGEKPVDETPKPAATGWPDGGVPPGWRAEGTKQEGPLAQWAVEAGVLRVVDPGLGAKPTFNLCWSDEPRFKDGTIEVEVKAGEGEIDRGGGPIWRARDKDNYYIARWNPLEDNFRVYKVVSGERIQLASADVSTDPDAWHVIRVRHEGATIECFLDGEKLLEATDDALPDEGGVGVWAKADAKTAFRNLKIE